MTELIPFAMGLTGVGCTLFYLASKNQTFLSRPLPSFPGKLAGALCLAISLWMFGSSMQPAAGVFVFSTWVMVLLTLLPVLGGFVGLKRSGHDG